MSDRITDKMSHDIALKYAEELVALFTPYCERIEIAGSLRRNKPQCSDLEIVVIPKTKSYTKEIDLFTTKEITVDLLSEFILNNPALFSKRKNIRGSEAYGDRNKLLFYTDPATQKLIPLDIFSADPHNFVMVKFIRTGSWQNNIVVAVQARKLGLKIEQFEGGYKDLETGQIIRCENEQQVYEQIGLQYLPPEKR